MKYTAVLGSNNMYDLFIDVIHYNDRCKYKHIKQPYDVMGLDFESVIKLHNWHNFYHDPSKIEDLCIGRIK